MTYPIPPIVDAEKLTPAQARYWTAKARALVGRVSLVDPWRHTLAELNARGFSGIVYRASTGGRWGRSAQVTTI